MVARWLMALSLLGAMIFGALSAVGLGFSAAPATVAARGVEPTEAPEYEEEEEEEEEIEEEEEEEFEYEDEEEVEDEDEDGDDDSQSGGSDDTGNTGGTGGIDIAGGATGAGSTGGGSYAVVEASGGAGAGSGDSGNDDTADGFDADGIFEAADYDDAAAIGVVDFDGKPVAAMVAEPDAASRDNAISDQPRIVTFSVGVRNDAAENVTIVATDFVLRNSDGVVIAPKTVSFEGFTLAPGAASQGAISFEVPAGVSADEFYWAPAGRLITLFGYAPKTDETGAAAPSPVVAEPDAASLANEPVDAPHTYTYTITASNDTDGEMTIDADEFVLRSSRGYVMAPTAISFDVISLAPGEAVQGTVTFELPAGVTANDVYWAPAGRLLTVFHYEPAPGADATPTA